MSQVSSPELSPPMLVQWEDGVQGTQFNSPCQPVEWSAGASPMSQPEMLITGEDGSTYYGAYGIVIDMGSVSEHRAPASANLTGATSSSGKQALHIGDYLPGFGTPIASIVVRSRTPAGVAVIQPGLNPFDTANSRIMDSHRQRYSLN